MSLSRNGWVRTGLTRKGLTRSGLAALTLLSLSLAGCTGTRMASEDTSPPPLPAAPAGTVEGRQLPPPATPDKFPEAPQTQVAAATPQDATAPAGPPPGGGGAVSKDGMVGSWKAGGADNCQVFMTLTKMGSMSRGGSRGCSGDLQNMRGWDVKGKQVVLYDDSGSQLAALYNSGGTRYDGQTSSGKPISLSR